MENDPVIQEQYPDVITSLIQNVEEHDTKLLEFSGLNNRVTDLENNVNELKSDLSRLSEEIANLSGGTYSAIEPKDDDIPKVFINGNIPTTKDDVLAELEYVSKTRQFKAYLEIKCQGDSSMAYPKKNFTIKMFSDEARTIKLKKRI